MVRLMTDPGPLRLRPDPVAKSWRQVIKGKGKGKVNSGQGQERELEEGEELEDRGSSLSETPSERAPQAADASPIRVIHAASEPGKSKREKKNQKRGKKRRSSRSRRRRKEDKAIDKTMEIVAAIYDEQLAKEVELNKQEKKAADKKDRKLKREMEKEVELKDEREKKEKKAIEKTLETTSFASSSSKVDGERTAEIGKLTEKAERQEQAAERPAPPARQEQAAERPAPPARQEQAADAGPAAGSIPRQAEGQAKRRLLLDPQQEQARLERLTPADRAFRSQRAALLNMKERIRLAGAMEPSKAVTVFNAVEAELHKIERALDNYDLSQGEVPAETAREVRRSLLKDTERVQEHLDALFRSGPGALGRRSTGAERAQVRRRARDP